MSAGDVRWVQRYGGWGLYTDQTSNGITLSNNVVFNTSHACLHLQGNNLTFTNNVLVKGGTSANGEGALKSVAHDAKDAASFAFDRNIVCTGTGVPAFTTCSLALPYAASSFDRNVYWGSAGRIFFPGNLTLAAWQRRGQDAHSAVADPLLDSNISSGNVQPGSPALRCGFVNIEASTVGPRLP